MIAALRSIHYMELKKLPESAVSRWAVLKKTHRRKLEQGAEEMKEECVPTAFGSFLQCFLKGKRAQLSVRCSFYSKGWKQAMLVGTPAVRGPLLYKRWTQQTSSRKDPPIAAAQSSEHNSMPSREMISPPRELLLSPPHWLLIISLKAVRWSIWPNKSLDTLVWGSKGR